MDFPTRYREGQEPSTLDLIFANEDYMVDNLRSCAPLGKSDHVGLVWTFQIYTGVYSRTGKSKVYDYMKGDLGVYETRAGVTGLGKLTGWEKCRQNVVMLQK